MNLFILTDIINIYSQRHLVVIFNIFSLQNDEKLLYDLFHLV